MADKKSSYVYGIGRRSSAVARIRLTSGKGEITINEQPADSYFAGSEYFLKRLKTPFEVLDLIDQHNVSVKVDGGGHSGQADAIRLAIARALATSNEDFKSTLKRAGLLERDSREKERKHFGLKKARKQRQFTKR